LGAGWKNCRRLKFREPLNLFREIYTGKEYGSVAFLVAIVALTFIDRSEMGKRVWIIKIKRNGSHVP
jgi:hypothetical protein